MPFILTSNAVLTCAHGGIVTVLPRQTQVMIAGGAVLRLTDLVGAPIVGCTQTVPPMKPCTTIPAPPYVGFAPTVLVGGIPVLLQTFQALTDGAPPGIVSVTFAGQALAQAKG
jgi:hypothetical protein